DGKRMDRRGPVMGGDPPGRGGGEQGEAGGNNHGDAEQMSPARGRFQRNGVQAMGWYRIFSRGNSGCGLRGGFDPGDEAVAGSRDGFDESRLAGVVIERFAKQADEAGEGAFGDGRVGPHGVEDLLLADQAAAVLDQVQEQAKSLWLKGNRRAVRRKAKRNVVGPEAVEEEDHRGVPCAVSSMGFAVSIMPDEA